MGRIKPWPWFIQFSCLLSFYLPPAFYDFGHELLQDIAEEIINNAIKELSIERGVQEVADIWAQMAFNIIPYEGRGTGAEDAEGSGR